MSDLMALARALAEARHTAAHWAAAVRDEQMAWEREHTVMLEAQAATKAQVALAEMALRTAALEAFRTTGEVAPAPGCKIVQRTVLDYDREKALAWAKGAGLALTLDVKTFEKLAKATPLPDVVVRQEPSVTVATDLDAALAASAV